MDNQVYDSPIGLLGIYADETAITEIKFDCQDESDHPSGLTEECLIQLKQYFEGRLTSFDLPLAPAGTDFQRAVWDELTQIEYGKSISYSELAIRLGDLKKIRAAGTANGKNPIPIIIPCHRVIGKDGSLVGFSGGLDKKEWLLKHEGILTGAQMSIFS